MKCAIGIAVMLAWASIGDLHAQNTVYQVDSTKKGDEWGRVVAGLGDANGDGYDDWAVGAPQFKKTGQVVGKVQIHSGYDGKLLWSMQGAGGSRFGYSIAKAGDLNQDGYADVLVGDPFGGPGATGIVHACSGPDGALLYTSAGLSDSDEYGYSVASVGDLDNDGIPEWIAGAPDDYLDGYVGVHSGASGKNLVFIYGLTEQANFGEAIVGLDDVDGDNRPDFAIGAPIDFFSGAYEDPPSRVHVFSGGSFQEIYSLHGKRPFDSFGKSLAATDDVDGDGVGDLLVGAGSGNYARVHSGVDGRIVHELGPVIGNGGEEGCRFGRSVSSGGDWDGDGIRDLLVGAPGAFYATLFLCPTEPGMVYAYSGRSGEQIGLLRGKPADGLGFSLSALGDFTGDGKDEFLVGAPNESMGFARVVSPNQLSLQVEPHFVTISEAQGTPTEFDLNAGAVFAGMDYWMFGSASGIASSTPTPGLELLPLQIDAYFQATLLNPSLPIFQNFRGQLDHAGRARAGLNLVNGFETELVGSNLYHAFGVFSATGELVFASNPAGVLVKPILSAVPQCELKAAKIKHPGSLLKFEAKFANDPDGSIVSYLWEFGDGATSALPISFHAYENPGTYEVRLTIADDQGNLGICEIEQVVLPPNLPPTCDFEWGQAVPAGSHKIYFLGVLASDEDGSIVEYAWDYGDGTKLTASSGSIFFHSFPAAGEYLVTLTVTDDDMASSTCTELVSVN